MDTMQSEIKQAEKYEIDHAKLSKLFYDREVAEYELTGHLTVGSPKVTFPDFYTVEITNQLLTYKDSEKTFLTMEIDDGCFNVVVALFRAFGKLTKA